ncbi:hypothetical protein [Streptomyces vilmorinianum]|uniref:hypothetical protein n=1 Tax=Streptomyces vilmorinianum TaxID=3051092 RepID=UPI0010FB764A|nr:hypothetical protein [Streptomyces vilmorinianum]
MKGQSRPRGRTGLAFAVGVLVLATGAWFLSMTIQETRDLGHGVGTTATLLDEPSDCSEGCRVTFDVATGSVVAKLPAHELIKRFHRGSDLRIVYVPEDPQRIALADSVGPGPIVLGSLIPLLGLFLVVSSSATWARSRLQRSRTP